MTTENKKFDWQKSFKINQIAEWYENNRKNANIGLIGLIVLIAGFIYYIKIYKPEQEVKAAGELFMAERYFEKDSMDKVLKGDGKYMSAVDVADEYGGTAAGNLAKFYAGRAYMSKKDFKNAIEYLEDVKFGDEIMAAMIIGLQADCYSELGEIEKAAGMYMKAGTKRKNLFTSPILLMKAGRHYDELKKWDEAVKAYKLVRDNYRESQQAQYANKYIARDMARMGKSPD
ncbi:MAG: tetratricopeptide repeat protein [Bacteroidia bacterium]